MANGLSRNLQEDLLVLLSFDSGRSKLIRNSVDVALFEGYYQKIAQRLYTYIDKFEQPPSGALATVFDDLIEAEDSKAQIFAGILTAIYDNAKSVNAEYAMYRITEFVRQQELKAGILEAADILQEGGEDASARAEVVLNDRIKKRLDLFDPGVVFGEGSLSFLDIADADTFTTGIAAFDRYKIGPARKQLHVLIGVKGAGKSHYLVNLGKRAMMEKYRVCHISLEMDWQEVIQRYWQAVGGVAKRQEEVTTSKLVLDAYGNLDGIDQHTIKPKLTFQDDNIREVLSKKASSVGRRLGTLIVKSFPTRSLTTKGLEAYLDSLEEQQSFVPDLLLIDYPDIMKIEQNDFRLNLGRAYEEIRGIAGARNIAVAAVSQSNREGAKAKMIRGEHVAEDWSKMMTADTVITYNQTEEEYRRGLARLYVDKARHDMGRFTVLVTQNYALGQFVRSSVLLKDYEAYEEMV